MTDQTSRVTQTSSAAQTLRADQLHLSGVGHSYGDRELFDGVDLYLKIS